MLYEHFNSVTFRLDIVDWFCLLAVHHTWSNCWLLCLPWTLSSEEHFFLLFLVVHLEELLPQGYLQHWKCVLLWQELYNTTVWSHKRRLVSFAVPLKCLMYMTFAGDFALCRVSRFSVLRALVGLSNVVWPQKWHHTISACGNVVQALILQSDCQFGPDSNHLIFLVFCHHWVPDAMSSKYISCRKSIKWLHARMLGK